MSKKKKKWIHVQTGRKRVVHEEVELTEHSKEEMPVAKVLGALKKGEEKK